MIFGLTSKSELGMLFNDPEGYSRLKDYINKFIDNIYQYANRFKERKIQVQIRKRIIEYRKLMLRLRSKMFAYSQILQDWINAKMEKYNILKSDIDNPMVSDGKNDITRQFGSFTDNQSFKSFLNNRSPDRVDWEKMKLENAIQNDMKQINSEEGRSKSKEARILSS